MKPAPEHHDNTLVRGGRNSNEYLAISLRPLDEHTHFRAYVYRYCVPGRCDTYSFQWAYGSSGPAKLCYFSDSGTPIAKVLPMVEADFNRTNVVAMCLNAFGAERVALHYSRDFLELLYCIAPKSLTYRKVSKLCEKTLAERSERMSAARAALSTKEEQTK